MKSLTTQNIISMVDVMSDIIIKNEVPFCELDSAAGDGDFGMSIAKGFKQLKAEWSALSNDDIGAFVKDCGMIIAENCGGASGPIWGTAFKSFARSAKGKPELSLAEFAEAFNAGVEGVMRIGGAKAGDKTLLDAAIPCGETLAKCAVDGEDVLSTLRKGANAAIAGAEATKNMVAKRGRASYVGERSLTYPDAGATALGIIFSGICDFLKA